MEMGLRLKSEEVALRLRELYRRYGYLPYKMSKFEEYDLYVRNKSFLVSDNILTFTDVDGKLMALKPDVTLSILKNSRQEAGLQKVYYNENVYRTSPGAHGYQEILQVGLECIGELDDYAVGEAVMLAARSLEIISSDYLLDVSHLGFVAALLEPLDLDEEECCRLLEAVGQKNTSVLQALARKWSLPEQMRDILCRLALLYAPPAEALPELEQMVCTDAMAAALDELRQLCGLMEQYGLDERLRLDFSIADDTRYYSGVVFRGFLPGLASGVLSGGRYDHMVHKMGRTGGAIGFAVYLDLLEGYFSAPKGYDVDVLLLYDTGVSPARVAVAANAVLASGKTVRIEREIPPELQYRELRRLKERG